MANKKTMKRKMKKRGSRRCWGGVGTRTIKKPSKKGKIYEASIQAEKTGSKIKAESKIVSKQVNNDLSKLFTSSMRISPSTNLPK